MDEAAPLLDIPEASPPPGGAAEWFRAPGGGMLRVAIFNPPPGRSRGTVILSGGRTEAIEKYYEVIADFLARGFVVFTHDWRGQGRSVRALSDRLKGHARGYQPFLDDFRAMLSAYEARLPKPWIAVGHSMGGCLTLLAMVEGEKRFSGAVLSAPMLGVKLGRVSPGAARFAARINVLLGRAGRYVPGQSRRAFEDGFEGNILTHDEARFSRAAAQLKADPDLALGAPTWGWLDFALKATDRLANPDRLRSVTVPVVIVSAGDDKLVDNAAQAAAARHLPQGKLIAIPEAFHEILMETDEMRNIFLRLFDALTGRAAPKPAEAPKAAPATPPAPVAATPAPAPTPAPAAAPVAKAPAAKAPAAKKPAAAKPAAAKPAVKKAPAAKAAPAKAPVKAAAKPAAKAAPKAAAKPAAKVAAKPAAKPAAAKAAPKAAPKAAAKPAAKAAPKAAAKPAAAKPAAAKKPATAAKKPAAKAAPKK